MAGGPRDDRAAERFLVDAEGEKLRAQALLALVDAAPGAIDELGPDRGLPLVCARLLRAMDCTTAVLSLVDFGRDTLESVAGYDVSGVRTTVCGSRSLASDATAARVIANREPLFAASEPSNPAAAGSVIQLFGTGGGQSVPATSTDGDFNPLNADGKLLLTTTVTIGGKTAMVQYAGPAPGLVAGVFQINATLPDGIGSGAVPVVVQIGTASTTMVVTVALQ